VTRYLQAFDLISKGQKAFLAVLLIAGISLAFFWSQSITELQNDEWIEQGNTEAERLTDVVTLWLSYSDGPLQSLATLFNGSGRVSAEEFIKTIDYLRDKRTGIFPDAMAFLIQSAEAGTEDELNGWVVAYSTNEEGFMMPGVNVSRFGPTRAAIAAALSTPDRILISPSFARASGTNTSFNAVTISNVRQFGVVVTTLDYNNLVTAIQNQHAPRGISLRLRGTFPDGNGMTENKFIYGSPEVTDNTLRTVYLSSTVSNARFDFSWDITDEFANGSFSQLPEVILYGLILVTVLIVVLMTTVLTTRQMPIVDKS